MSSGSLRLVPKVSSPSGLSPLGTAPLNPPNPLRGGRISGGLRIGNVKWKPGSTVYGYWKELPTRLSQVEALRVGAPKFIASALEKVARETILPQSKEEVPVDTGALRSTGRVNKPISNPGGTVIKIEIAYGGHSQGSDVPRRFVDYAVVQHEIPFAHKQGKWKYLEHPVYQNTGELTIKAHLAMENGVRAIFSSSYNPNLMLG